MEFGKGSKESRHGFVTGVVQRSDCATFWTGVKSHQTEKVNSLCMWRSCYCTASALTVADHREGSSDSLSLGPLTSLLTTGESVLSTFVHVSFFKYMHTGK